MFELEFALAYKPQPAKVFGLWMQPYSIGHDIELLRIGNPFAEGKSLDGMPDEDRFKKLVEAVLICSQTWEENQKPHKWVRLWAWINRGRSLILESENFLAYRKLGTLQPWVELPKEAQDARLIGGPFHCSLIQHLVTRIGKTERKALDFPMGAAKFLYYSHLEHEGNVRIINQEEWEFEEYCRTEDEKAAKARKN